jgi:hypothetical protein
VWTRSEVLEARLPRRLTQRCGWDLDALSVEELEELLPLSAKQAAAEAAGVPAAWTRAELALLGRLAAKAGADR